MRLLNAYLDGGPLRGQTLHIAMESPDFVNLMDVPEDNTGWISINHSIVAVPKCEVLHIYWRNGTLRDGMQVFQHVRSSSVERDDQGIVFSGKTLMADGTTTKLNPDDLKAIGPTIETRPR